MEGLTDEQIDFIWFNLRWDLRDLSGYSLDTELWFRLYEPVNSWLDFREQLLDSLGEPWASFDDPVDPWYARPETIPDRWL